MAIAFDTVTHGGMNGANTLTVSHTCTGSNLILLALFTVQGTDAEHVTGVTYNSVAMTKILRHYYTSNGGSQEAWYLINPATGTHDIVISLDALLSAGAINVSYTGAKQSAQPDSFSGTNVGASSANFAQNVVTVADNAWGIWYAENGGNYFGAPNGTFNTGATARYISVSGDGVGITNGVGDSNIALTPAGTYSGNANRSNGAADWQGFTLSIAPAAAATTTLPSRALLGVGI